MELFDSKEKNEVHSFSLDERLNPEEVQFVIFLLKEQLEKITLTTSVPFINAENDKFGIVNDQLFINGTKVEVGSQEIEGKSYFIVSQENARTNYFIRNDSKYFMIGNDKNSGIEVSETAMLVLNETKLIVRPRKSLVYVNGQKIRYSTILPIEDGVTIFTPSYYLEKRREQWKITMFKKDVKFCTDQLLKIARIDLFPKDFPDYRRSPRLNLEVPDGTVRLDDSTKNNTKDKNSLLKTLLPPIGMLAMTGFTTILSGRNPVMMLGMGGMSLMTAGFTTSQYFTEKKEKRRESELLADDYKIYLVNEVSKLGAMYEKEKKILNYQYPTVQELYELVNLYDARIYERQRHNKDFLEVSLGLSDQPSKLKIDVGVESKDLSENAEFLRSLQNKYSTQRDSATPISMKNTTIGFIGTEAVLNLAVQSLLFQTTFFHSYQDVNFIHLLSKESFMNTWKKWRLLPHFKLSELNMRGLIYSQKLRDVVLNAFYQLMVKRRQAVNEAGKEVPSFSPHYIFTIQDDSYLAGHGINELLAEDMSDLGVTVIWCKENAKLLPETVTTLIDVPNKEKGRLISVNGIYLDKEFCPYQLPADLERGLRTISNLHHLEVEKNAVPESLSLLEQYEVRTVEDLEISKRWKDAQPNKSIKSLIGWRGKSDYAYWDLHERAHGPHALVGGTTGSGKSEFLTTYLIGLAINFSPEDIGMLIIDWKGGGIANTLDKLPHFMGAITNLDGAGTARALASIKAELDKRQREFAKFGVNNINGYMSLYKERLTPKPDVNYPSKPLPHLVLVSDEFAELKSNVPEFLDELTSVARIGRSLGVHLILATQKPSGVVNDQIEANSTSKIALKMASIQDSNELLKTPDAAHITNPGRGYLKVGQNEVYELFQSGYAGIPYDPETTQEEIVDERIYKINELGQYELLYDPGEEVSQGKDTSDLPTQLEAVIAEIENNFGQANYRLPDKPWLPNLAENIPTPIVKNNGERNLKVPLGLLDIPSNQTQENFDFDLSKQGHTAIFSSGGYGKSTVLQTLVINLAKLNNPEQLQFCLLDFGNNGLLPLKDLPHVIDIVMLEEEEKLQKMLQLVAETINSRKQIFKEGGVATLEQYETKTNKCLPIILVALDSYDGLSSNDSRKDTIDNLLLQLLRNGPSLGLYLVITASRTSAIRMNMMSNISTKMVLYLNDESEVTTIMGRDRVTQVEVNGRGQVMLDVPRAIQFYLPVTGENSTEILENLEIEVATMNAHWLGVRPEKIPMVAEQLTVAQFDVAVAKREKEKLYIGLNKANAKVESFALFKGKSIGIFSANRKQLGLLSPFILSQLFEQNSEVILIDALKSLEEFSDKATLYISREDVINHLTELKETLELLMVQQASEEKQIIVFNGIAEILEKNFYQQAQFLTLIEQNTDQRQLIFMDYQTKVGDNFAMSTVTVRDNMSQILFGGEIASQHFIENLPLAVKNVVYQRNVLHCVLDEELSHIVVPTVQKEV